MAEFFFLFALNANIETSTEFSPVWLKTIVVDLTQQDVQLLFEGSKAVE